MNLDTENEIAKDITEINREASSKSPALADIMYQEKVRNFLPLEKRAEK